MKRRTRPTGGARSAELYLPPIARKPMTTTNASTTKLETMKLPALQARYREVLGEATRCPNRTFLIRKISEALASQAAAESEAVANRSQPQPKAARQPKPSHQPEAEQVSKTEQPPRGRFATMTVAELQAKYLEVVGRATGSDDRRYMIWKIREAEKGRVPVGPRKTRESNGEPLDVKILPLRLEAEVVLRMDEAWRSRGIKNRMEFFRCALGHYLTHLGAEDAASLFNADSAT
jgi:hypothetical protein